MAKSVGLNLISGIVKSGNDIQDTGVDIVAVHGLGGHSFGTWISPESGAFWLKDFLPESFPEARIFVYGYSSCLDTPTNFLTIAENLLDELLEQRRVEVKENQRKTIFICHGLGGLVVKQALIRASEYSHGSHRAILETTSGIVFLGTPHRGDSNESEKVLRYIESITKLEKGYKTEDCISTGLLPQIKGIQKTFQDFHERELFKFQIVSFFEELPVPGFGLVVDEVSIVPSSFRILPIHANHENICKFRDYSTSNYQQVLGELKKLACIGIEKQSLFSLKEKECLRWLQIDNGSSSVSSPFAGTLTWVLDHTAFTSWIEDDQNSLLWITGKSGAGKSTLMKFLFENLQNGTVEIPRTTSAFFFFDQSQNTTNTTTRGILQSLLYQILSQIPSAMSDFIPLLAKQWDYYTNLDNGFDDPWSLDHAKSDLSCKSSSLSAGLLEEYLITISKTHRVCFLIDGLDECSDEVFFGIWSIFSSLNSSLEENPIKLCITSGPGGYLEAIYSQNQRKIVLELENTKDIQQFVDFGIKSLSQSPKGRLGKFIVQKIVERASGNFLWAKLVIDLLKNSKNLNEMTELSVSKIPDSLEDVYRLILDRLLHNDDSLTILVEKLLIWVCLARRPLSVEEMRHALGADFMRSNLQHNTPDSYNSIVIFDKTQLIDYCWGLLEIRKPNATLHFVHRTAYDFIVNEISKVTSVQHAHSHLLLAETCGSYLSFDAENSSRDQKLIEGGDNSFLDYAARNWAVHAKLADCPGISHKGLLKTLNWPFTKVLGHWAHLHQRVSNHIPSDYWGWTAIHVSAAFGIGNLALAIRDIIGLKSPLWHTGDANGRTPLSLAAKNGHTSIVKILIEAGATITTKDFRCGFSPLQWASLQGHQDIINILLQNGADPNDNMGGSSALLMAAIRGHKQVLELLLHKGANPNLVNQHFGWTPLHISAGNGRYDMVSLLLAHGANPNITNPLTKKTPLYYAITRGDIDIVRLLLDHGGRIQQDKTTLISWVERVANSFPKSLGSTNCWTPRTCTSSETNDSSYSGHAQTNGTGGNNSGESKKRNRENSEFGSGRGAGDSGNGPNKRPTLGPTLPLPSIRSTFPLACPYFKYDSMRYGSKKPCRGPVGWPDVNRLKEHLYYHHHVKPCPRCYAPFKNNQDVETHLRGAELCTPSQDRNFSDGFDDNQYERLKDRACYEDTIACKKSYDESLDRARRQDPVLGNRIYEVIHGMEADALESIFRLIHEHQVEFTNPGANESAGQAMNLGNNTQMTTSNSFSGNTPLPSSYPTLNFNTVPFTQTHSPFLLHPPSSQGDSGFCTGSLADTEDSSLFPVSEGRPIEYSYSPSEFSPLENQIEDFSAQSPRSMATQPEDNDPASIILPWISNDSYSPEISPDQASFAGKENGGT